MFKKITVRRVVWLVVILAVILAYFPINRLVNGGHTLDLPVDKLIPFYPPALVPYLLASLLFVIFPIWMAFYARPRQFEAYVISICLASVVAYIVYIFYPTCVIRPEVTGHDFFSRMIVLLYQGDYPNNAAPSGHTFYTVLSFLYLRQWKKGTQIIGGIVALIILVSILLVKQHYILDLAAGLVVAVGAYLAGGWAQNKWDLHFAS